MSRELLANLDLIRGEDALLLKPPDTTAARTAFDSALHRYDREIRGVLFNQLGIFFRSMGYSNLALKAYHEGLKQPVLAEQNRDEILFNISNVYKGWANDALQRRDPRGAVENFVKAAEYDPLNERVVLNIALLYERELGKPQEAIPWYERYLKLDPDNDQVRRALDAIK